MQQNKIPYLFPNESLENHKIPLVIAHRGGMGLWPENTMFAFQNAVELGANALEMDIHSTKDQVLVVCHDSIVDRVTNGTGAITNLTLAEIKDLDAGYRWSKDDKTFPFRGKGYTIPTLEEIFQAFPNIWLSIDIKEHTKAIIPLFVQLIQKYKVAKNLAVGSFDAATLKRFHRTCPEVATVAAKPEAVFFYIMTTFFSHRFSPLRLKQLHVPAYRNGKEVVNKRIINASKLHQLRLAIWTINEPQEMQHFLDLGINSIITDYPDRLLKVLAERN